jgi:WD40 repeat protein
VGYALRAGLAGAAIALSLWVTQADSLPSLGGPTLAEVQTYLFLSQEGSRQLAVLDTSSDKLVGNLELGLVPSRIEVSKSTRKLTAIDGTSSRVEILDLGQGGGRDLTLPFIPKLLTLSPDGKRLAVGSNDAVTLIDLEHSTIITQASGFATLRDLMFSSDGNSLYAAGDQLSVLDANHKLERHSQLLPVAGFTRSPDGRALFVKGEDGAVSVLDSKSLEVLTKLSVGQAQPSATGAYLLLLNGEDHSLTLIHGDSWETGQKFEAAADATTAYSGWFDSVAVVPSKSGKSLEVIDLWRQTRL